MHYFIPLAYDRIDPIKGTGKGTIERCKALLAEVLRIQTQQQTGAIFISTAGYTKESPNKPTPEVQVALAEQIADQVKGFQVEHVVHPIAWGTYAEITTAFEEIVKYTRDHNVWGVDIYISTNPGHIPRAKMCCWFLRRKLLRWYNVKFHFIPAHHSFTPKEWGQETIKFFVYLYRFLFKKW